MENQKSTGDLPSVPAFARKPGPIHFACTQCGKCCSFPDGSYFPISPSEAIALADRFPLLTSVQVYPSPLLDNAREKVRTALSLTPSDRRLSQLTKDWMDGLRRGAHFIPMKGIPGCDGVLVQAFPVVVPNADATCPALKDNRCTIYEDRPLTCRTFPMTQEYPYGLGGIDTVAKLAHEIRLHNFECDVSDQAPVLIKPGPGGKGWEAVAAEAKGIEAPLDAARIERRQMGERIIAMGLIGEKEIKTMVFGPHLHAYYSLGLTLKTLPAGTIDGAGTVRLMRQQYWMLSDRAKAAGVGDIWAGPISAALQEITKYFALKNANLTAPADPEPEKKKTRLGKLFARLKS